MHLILRNVPERNDPCYYDWTLQKLPDGLALIWHDAQDGEAARVTLSVVDLQRLRDMLNGPWEASCHTHEHIEGDDGCAFITNEQGVKVIHMPLPECPPPGGCPTTKEPVPGGQCAFARYDVGGGMKVRCAHA